VKAAVHLSEATSSP